MQDSFADLRIDAAFIAPMRVHEAPLQAHSLLIREGRILDLLPTAEAQQRYRVSTVLERPAHLLLPGMINMFAQAELSLIRASFPAQVPPDAEFAHDSVRVAIAEMLKSGISCFQDHCRQPDAVARAAREQGMRVQIGLPISVQATSWAGTPREYLSRALEFRDEYRHHPLISTCFAPQGINDLPTPVCERMATLANELDAGVCAELLLSEEEEASCELRYGMRPLQRVELFGLLTPAFCAVHMTQAEPEDAYLAAQRGIAVVLCPQMNLKVGAGLPSVAAFADLRVALGSASGVGLGYDLFGDLRLAALLEQLSGFDALSLVTRQAAAALGLEEVGTLEAGKWADLCCVELPAPAEGTDPLAALVYRGSRDWVSDVWVGGRQLLSDRTLTRFDWPDITATARQWGRS